MDFSSFPPMLISDLTALAQVMVIDLALAGDNAIVVGIAVAGLPAHQQKRAILIGIIGATVIRILLGAITLQLLAVIGLMLAGGLLLVWVLWKMYRELRVKPHEIGNSGPPTKTMRQAMIQIVVADLSMSLDNVLAVAGAARDSLWVLVVGLTLSVALMGLAAGLVARLLERYRWIAWIGLVIVLGVAIRMIWDGSHEVLGVIG